MADLKAMGKWIRELEKTIAIFKQGMDLELFNLKQAYRRRGNPLKKRSRKG